MENITFKLNNGVDIPVLGLGTYQSEPGKEVINAVKFSLEYGYRHIDTAALYRNEEDIGKAVRESNVKREEIFITTKLWNSDHGYDKALKAFDISLKKLGLEYIDLYLIHWPVQDLRKESWKALERLYDEKLVRTIGVSNYTIDHLKELFNYANVIPAVNQVEFSPFLYQKELLDFCMQNQIYIEAYTPLTRGKKLNDPTLLKLADKYGKTTAQIIIRWCIQVNTIVLPKSVNEKRIAENAEVFDFRITDEDMALLNALNQNYRVAWDPSNAF